MWGALAGALITAIGSYLASRGGGGEDTKMSLGPQRATNFGSSDKLPAPMSSVQTNAIQKYMAR